MSAIEQRDTLLSDLLSFTKTFYFLKNGREFLTPDVVGRKSHYLTVSQELENMFYGRMLDDDNNKTYRLIINIPPGYGKSTMLVYFIAWAMANYPDSQIMYISYSYELAEKHTATIKEIMEMPAYQALFNVQISGDTKAKGDFKTTAGGRVKAFGSSGPVTGMDAGFPGADRFTGLAVLDDPHKPDEVHSDARRENVIRNFMETIYPRPRADNVPICMIGQCLHQADLADWLKTGKDGFKWRKAVLKGIDEAGNALAPHLKSLETLRLMQEFNPYVFASQFQQDPVPAGGALFKEQWFVALEYEPDILATFLTCDTAETDKTWNDATAFSFWGVYKMKFGDIETEEYALHLLDCVEIWVEPADLEKNFYEFYANCMRYKIKPLYAAIEKKSTGVTLSSTLSRIPGIRIVEMERTAASKSKAERFLEIQPYIARKQVTLPRYGKHNQLFIEHMTKITANDTHRRDDICFIAGTQIATLFGYKNIEDIKKGDFIITPFGIGKVSVSGCTGFHPITRSNGLIGTHAHPIFVGNRFERLDALSDDSRLDRISFLGLIKWKYKKLLYLMESNTNLWGRESIILVNQQSLESEKVLKDCMSRFMNFIVERKFRKGGLFIIKIMIVLITTISIWSVFRAGNISRCMQKSVASVLAQIKNWLTWKRLGSKLQNGIEALRGALGIESMQKQVFSSPISSETLHASIVQNHLSQNISMHNTAIQIAEQELIAAISVKPVYNLTVEVYGVYYANTILVSNCDTVVDAVRAALIDKLVLPKTTENSDKILQQMQNSFNMQQSLMRNRG